MRTRTLIALAALAGTAGLASANHGADTGRLQFGILDIANYGISMSIDQTTGVGTLEMSPTVDGTSFAIGFQVDDGDVELSFGTAVDVFMTDSSGTTAIPTGPVTVTNGSRFVIHGEAGSQLEMQWQDEAGSEAAIIGIDCGECSINVNGDMASFRYAGPFYATLEVRGEGELQMSAIGDVSSSTLTLPPFGEEGDVTIPAGEHTIVLGPDSGNDDLAWLLIRMDDGGNSGGDGCFLPEDIDGSGQVDVGDLLAVIAAWGNVCP